MSREATVRSTSRARGETLERQGGPGGARPRLTACWQTAQRHPVLTVAVVAAVTRLAAALTLGPLRDGYLLPDEAQYLRLALFVASGRGAEAFEPGRGQELFDTTASFMLPLTALVVVFGEHQILGQLLSAAFGVLTAALTTVLAQRVVASDFALLSGLIVAVMPSQVLWSSVVLRESMVWCSLVVLALALSTAATTWDRRRLLLCAGGVAGGLFALAHLRGLTAVLAGAAVALTVVVVRYPLRLLVPTVSLLLVAVVPWAGGLGIGGFSFVEQAVPRLAVVRTALSLDADSSFVDKKSVTVAPSQDAPAGTPSKDAPAGSKPVVVDQEGQAFEVEDGGSTNLRALPRGLVAVVLRPFPWEASSSVGLAIAKLENLLWYGLYGLAGLGAWVGWGRRQHLMFPLVAVSSVLLVAAVTQGNLGTAFRHRGQLLWAVAILAAIGLEHVVSRRRMRAKTV